VIVACTSVEQPGWLALRTALWPDTSEDAHRAEMAEFLADAGRYRQFVAYDRGGDPVGFVEASLRSDHVNGTETTPVAFLEGIYVAPSHRRTGVARRLLDAVIAWARQTGCRELASDVEFGNSLGHVAHRGLGFVETERAVFYRRDLR
jgi:aminoglycoside 6'-N-acetyltransferase I